MQELLFHTKGLTVGYNGKPLIRDIGIEVKAGEILTLIGPNGSGKSTILKSITRQLKILGGAVYIGEKDLLSISLKELDLEAKHAEYAVTMRSGFHGQGIGTQATELLLKKAFVEFGLERVYLTVLADNAHAKHMYERAGFVKEGTLRKHIYRDGQFLDWDLYGILKEDFV